jgi:hypothetical protein
MHVAFSAITAPGNHESLIFFGKVSEQLAGLNILHLGANRHQYSKLFTALASLLFSAAVGAPGRLEVTLEVKIEEGLFGTCGLDYNITALASISAVRTASRHIFLAPKTDTAFAAVTGPNVDFDLINKTHGQR